MLCNNGAPVQACAIARSPEVERARASCSVGLKKLFAFTEFYFVVSVVQGHNTNCTCLHRETSKKGRMLIQY